MCPIHWTFETGVTHLFAGRVYEEKTNEIILEATLSEVTKLNENFLGAALFRGHKTKCKFSWGSTFRGHKTKCKFWSPVTGHRSLVTGHRSLVAGRWSLVAGRWSSVPDRQFSNFQIFGIFPSFRNHQKSHFLVPLPLIFSRTSQSRWLPVAGRRSPVAGQRSLVAGRWSSVPDRKFSNFQIFGIFPSFRNQ